MKIGGIATSVLIGLIPLVTASLLNVFLRTPQRHNNIIEEIREQEERERITQEEGERIEREFHAALEESKREAAQKAQAERELTERQQRDERERHRKEKKRARKKAKRQEDLRHVQEKRRLEEVSRARLAETQRILQTHKEEASRQREELKCKQAELQSKYMAGIQPEVFPTLEERERAEKQLLEPKEEYFHCAIAGLAGSGKSSLVNAFHGSAVAPTGVTETTMVIRAYLDPSTALPKSRFVWYDVPGAGTNKIKSWQYFNSQGLFVFDLIIVVIDNRFTEQDLDILKHCERYKIPSFIVRSKADQHILNTMKEDPKWEGDPDDKQNFEAVYQKAREKVVNQTRTNYSEILKGGGLDPEKQVYIISCTALTALVTGEFRKLKETNQLIDEPKLVLGCLEAMKERRY